MRPEWTKDPMRPNRYERSTGEVVRKWPSTNWFVFFEEQEPRGSYSSETDAMKYVDAKYPAPTQPATKRKPFERGKYGIVTYHGISQRGNARIIINSGVTADELREAAHFFNQLAEQMEQS